MPPFCRERANQSSIVTHAREQDIILCTTGYYIITYITAMFTLKEIEQKDRTQGSKLQMSKMDGMSCQDIHDLFLTPEGGDVMARCNNSENKTPE